MDLEESATAGKMCVKEASGKFLQKPALPLAWKVISELEIIKELQNQSITSPVVLTQDNIFDTTGDLIDRYFLNIEHNIVDEITEMHYLMEDLVNDADQVTALLKDYSAQTKMDDSYFM